MPGGESLLGPGLASASPFMGHDGLENFLVRFKFRL